MTHTRMAINVGLIGVGLFLASLFGTTSPALAEEAAEKDLQCYYFVWQEPQCTFCYGACMPGGDCCKAPAQS